MDFFFFLVELGKTLDTSQSYQALMLSESHMVEDY